MIPMKLLPQYFYICPTHHVAVVTQMEGRMPDNHAQV